MLDSNYKYPNSMLSIDKKEFVVKLNAGKDDFKDDIVANYYNKLKFRFKKCKTASECYEVTKELQKYLKYLSFIKKDSDVQVPVILDDIISLFKEELNTFNNSVFDQIKNK
jgi:hypothetical protein